MRRRLLMVKYVAGREIKYGVGWTYCFAEGGEHDRIGVSWEDGHTAHLPLSECEVLDDMTSAHMNMRYERRATQLRELGFKDMGAGVMYLEGVWTCPKSQVRNPDDRIWDEYLKDVKAEIAKAAGDRAGATPRYLVRPYDSQVFELDDCNGCYRAYDPRDAPNRPDAYPHFTFDNLVGNYGFVVIGEAEVEKYEERSMAYTEWLALSCDKCGDADKEKTMRKCLELWEKSQGEI